MLKLLVISFQSCLFLYFYNIVCACPDTLEKKKLRSFGKLLPDLDFKLLW